MKVRIVALAGISLLAFTLAATAGESGGATSGGATSSGTSAPPVQPPPPPPPPPPPAPVAEVMTQGWYAGVGAGYDRLGNVEEDSVIVPPGNNTFGTNSSALVTGTWGYRFPDRLRFEAEVGWDQHGLNNAVISSEPFTGHLTTWSFLLNGAYDFKLSSKWDYTVGAGAGVGEESVSATGSGGDSTSGTHQGFMWQAFTGVDYWVCNNVSLNADWRYRSLSVNKAYSFDNGVFPYHLKSTNEQALMLSVRWYPWASSQ
jgi:opacity protein-like surface antigen